MVWRRNPVRTQMQPRAATRSVNEVIYQTQESDEAMLSLLHGVFVNSFKLLNNGILMGKCG